MQARSILNPLYDGISQLHDWLRDENREVGEVATVALEAQMLGEMIGKLADDATDLFRSLLDEADDAAVKVRNAPIAAEARTWLMENDVDGAEDLDDGALIRAMNDHHPDGWIGFHQARFNK